jgi:hypothetical protein
LSEITFQFAVAIRSPWTEVPSLSLGSGEIETYLLVSDSQRALRCVRLCREHNRDEAWFRSEAVAWRGRIAVGFGQRAYLVSPDEPSPRCVRLQRYFGDFHSGDDWLLIASGMDITRIDPSGNVVWRSEPVGIDGVIIERVSDGVIYGEGEWDPPGGWRKFGISLADGRALA